MTGKTSGEGIKHDLVVGDDFSEKATLNQVEPGAKRHRPTVGLTAGFGLRGGERARRMEVGAQAGREPAE